MGWYSEYYKEKNKDKLKEIEQNKDKKDSDETDGRIRDWGGHKKDAGNVKQDRTTKHEESKEIDKKSYSRPYWIKDIKTGNIKPGDN